MWPELALIVAGAFAAAFVAGVTGFGDAVVASAVWLQFLLPVETVTLAVACFFTMHIVMLALMHKRLSFRYLWPFLLGGTLGVPLGTQLLSVMDPQTFKAVAGAFLIVYGIVMLSLSKLPPVTGGGRLLDGTIGGVGGVLGGFAGLSGFIPGLWCSQRGWSKAESRGVTQPYIMAMHGMALGWLALGGMVTATTGTRYLACLPAIAVGAWLGVKLYGRFNDTIFRKSVLCVLTLAGVILVLNPGGQ